MQVHHQSPHEATLPRTSEALVAVDSSQRVVAWNQEAERMFGRLAADVLGEHCYQAVGAMDLWGRPFCRDGCPVMAIARACGAPPTLRLQANRRFGGGDLIDVSTLVLTNGKGLSTVLHLCRQPRSSRGLARNFGEVETTSREREVLAELCCGRSTKGVAEELGVSTTTVRNHVQHLLAKFGAHSRLELVAMAFEDGYGPFRAMPK